jgi:hypothetical protein
MLKLKRVIASSIGKGMMQLELSHTAAGNFLNGTTSENYS